MNKFITAPNWVMKSNMPNAAKICYIQIANYSLAAQTKRDNEGSFKLHISDLKLMEKCGMCKTKWFEAKKYLIENHYIEIDTFGDYRIYYKTKENTYRTITSFYDFYMPNDMEKGFTKISYTLWSKKFSTYKQKVVMIFQLMFESIKNIKNKTFAGLAKIANIAKENLYRILERMKKSNYISYDIYNHNNRSYYKNFCFI